MIAPEGLSGAPTVGPGASGYSGTPLPKKLGIVTGGRVLLVAAPAGFELAPLPPEVDLRRSDRGPAPYDVVVVFCPDAAALRRRFEGLSRRITDRGALWVCWPKKASGVPTDLTGNVVRDHGLTVGLVDVKVAAVDATWSGLKFVYRLADRPR